MQTTTQLYRDLEAGLYDHTFRWLYPETEVERVRERYQRALVDFEKLYGAEREAILVSAPGRTEIGGNHTDHQHGMVLAAAVNLDIICVVSPNRERSIRIKSEGYPEDVVNLEDLSIQESEVNHAASILRGVAAWFDGKGYQVGGLDAYTTSEVLTGSGLSSSAAFEVAVGNMLSHLYNEGRISPVEIAIAGQYAENVYFGKPSGLMDQMASSVGSFVRIDFEDPENPVVEPVSCDFAAAGYHLCIVDTRGSHADLTPDYAAIPVEMGKISAHFGKQYLRDVREADFYAAIPVLREKAGDRAVLRAIHFFDDHNRILPEVQALRDGRLEDFFRLQIEAGYSSFMQLQNVFSGKNPHEQGVSLALTLSRRFLEPVGGSWRIQGGGFAGTIQTFVPDQALEQYRSGMEAVFGTGACHVLSVRPVGGVRVTPELRQMVENREDI